MSKRVSKQLNSFKYKGQPIKAPAGTLALICFCIVVLIVATFTQLSLTPPSVLFNVMMGKTSLGISSAENVYRYIPQIPALFFIIALLGRTYGILAIFSYIVLGMFFPIFALGGGISYLWEYGFGYILAFIPAVFFTGTLLKIKTDFLRIVLMSVLGVITIHILGILYMLFVSALRHAQMDIVFSWIASQSGIQILYDIFFTIIAIYIGRFAKKIFWIIMC